MTIFGSFRRLVAGIEALESALRDLERTQREQGPATERLDALELSRHQFEAECHANVLKADSTLKAAANAEQRERHLKRQNEKLVDDFDPVNEDRTSPPRDADLGHDAAAGEEERLQAMRLVLAPNKKARAVAAKWGR